METTYVNVVQKLIKDLKDLTQIHKTSNNSIKNYRTATWNIEVTCSKIQAILSLKTSLLSHLIECLS